MRPRLPRRLPRPIDDTDLARAIAAAPSASPLRCFLLLAAFQGLRCQEIAGLRGEDVDRDAELLTVRHGKGGHERALPLHPLVAAQLPRVAGGPLFTLAGGSSPLRSHNVSHVVNDHLHSIGIAASAHTLRHWHATKLYQATNDLRMVQELLGHASVATTQIYAGWDRAKAGPAVAALTVGPLFGSGA